MEVDSYVIANGTSRIYHRTAGRRVRTLDAFRAWPAGACLYWNVGCASWTIRAASRKTRRRFASDHGPVPCPLLAPWRAGVAALAAYGDFLAPRPVHSPAWGLGVLLYWSVAGLLTALVSYGGCEVVALPSLLFRRYYTVYCPLNAIDLIERRYTRTGNEAEDQG